LENPNVYLPQIASSLGSLGNVYLTITKDPEMALKHYEEAYTVLKPFTEANQQHNLYYLSRIVRNLAFAYEHQGQHEKALTKLTESLRISKHLARKNRHHLYDVAEIHEQTASVHFKNKDFANSLREAKNALEIYESLSQENPISYLKKVARCSFDTGIVYCEIGDNEGAKDGFKQTLESYRALLKLSKNEETTIDNAVEGMTCFFKAQVYMLTVQGTGDEDLNIYGTEFKSVLESFGLSDNECLEMITRKIPQLFGPAEQKENDDHPIWSSSD
jgi:tetratricopeptide (TPR) repeat protein